MNRDYFINSFTKDNFPRFSCPFCNEGIIEINEKCFIENITEAAKAFNEVTGEVEGMVFRFVCILKCNNKNCMEIITMEGDGDVKDEFVSEDPIDVAAGIVEDYPKINHVSHYDIKYVYPPINIIDINKGIPPSIEEILKESFSLFWNHTSSAGNKIRYSIEVLLNDKGVVKKRKNSKGKYYDLSLHKRLEEFEKINSKIETKLTSLKWLGNEGSHAFSLNKNDLLDAYEIFDNVLYELYTKNIRDKKIDEMSEALTKKYGKG